MPFTVPRFQESGEIQFVENLLVLINRDMKTALDYFNLALDLPAFAVMSDGPLSVFSYPLIEILDEGMASDETESGEWLSQDLRVTARFAVKATTLKDVRALARKYVRALKAVIRSAPASELLPPAAQYLDYVIDIRHQFQAHGEAKDASGKIQPVVMEIRVRFGEK